jgi:integrating conjugative element protein (TIGR03758 family)
MAMTAAQTAAFQAGSGGYTPADLELAITMVVTALLLTWLMWVLWGAYRSWSRGEAELIDLIWSALRGSALVMFLGYFLR